MAVTRKLVGWSIQMTSDGLLPEMLSIRYEMSVPQDPDNPLLNIPDVSAGMTFSVDDLPVLAQTKLDEIGTAITNKLNVDRPLNTG